MFRLIAGRRAAAALALALALAVSTAACVGGSGPQGAGSGTQSASPRSPTPIALSTSLPTTPPTITLAFGGDVHFEGVLGDRLAADPNTALGPLAGLLSSADLAMVNLETAVTTRGAPEPKGFNFRAPATAFQALRAAGVDVVTMANNHGMDYGLVGLEDSLAAIRATGFPVVGIGLDDKQAYAPRYATVKGMRVAVVGATQVLDDPLITSWTAGPRKPGLASAKWVARTVQAVEEARRHADVVVVYLHYGAETVNCPTQSQHAIATALSAAGADVIVGSHAHVLLGAGWMGHSYVDYGLGNFAFYSSGWGPNTQTGVLFLDVRRDAGHGADGHGGRVVRAGWVPAHIEGGVPIPLQGTSVGPALSNWNALRACTGLSATG